MAMKLAASPGFAPSPPISETGALLIMQRGNGRPERFCPSDFWVQARRDSISPRGKELVEPEVVATSPYRIKSPVPVCCGFDSLKLVGERGLAPPRLTDSR